MLSYGMSRTLWNIWSKFSNLLFYCILIGVIAFSLWLSYQVTPDFGVLMELLMIPLIPFFFIRLILALPIWLQAVYLFAIYKFANTLILKILVIGSIDYNFTWTLPKWINDTLGISISSDYATFAFWSIFILSALCIIIGIGDRYLLSQAKKNVPWAKEVIDERMKNDKRIDDNFAREKGGEIEVPKYSEDPNKRIVFKPNFFKDKLWYPLAMSFIMISPIIVMSLTSDLMKNSIGTITIISFILIFLPFFIWEISTRIVLEKDKILVKSLLSRKTILYEDIVGIDSAENGAMRILYIHNSRQKSYQLLPWAFTTEKVVQELKNRLKKVNINEELIIKKVRLSRNLTSVIVTAIIVGLLMAGLYFLITKLQNREKYSKEKCSEQLEFWISDKEVSNILETKDGYIPKIGISNPFYFWIKSKTKAVECTESVTYVIYNSNNRVIYESTPIIPGYLEKIGDNNKIISYYTTDLFPDSGSYTMEIYYGDILADEIEFTVR